jgi:outer membrane receptor protein involved in Fe transport
MLKRWVAWLAPLALLSGAAPAMAQDAGTGKITGVVTDGSTGKPVDGAVIVVTNPAANVEQTVVSESGGKFTVEGLPPGDYKLAVQIDAYKPFERTDLKVKESTTLRANAALTPEGVQLEEVVVTGSRIRRKDLTTPAPVTVITHEQLQASGTVTIGQFLQTLPEQGGGTNTTVNNGGDGSTTVSLRNLGAQRTLVLIDGKRMISGVPGGGNLGDPGVDLNSIPTGAIERIDIMKDGASAIYGSDAIAGVVNIITKKKVNGVELTVNGARSSRDDAGIVDVSVLAGATGDKGGFSMGLGYYKQDSMLAANRDWAKEALTYDYASGTTSPGGSSRIPSGRAAVDPSTCTTKLCQDLLAAYGPGKRNFMPATTTPDPVNAPLVDGWRAYLPSDSYNFQAVNYLITPSKRYQLYSNGEYHINDNVRAYFHATFVRREASTQLAPVPLDTGSYGITMSADNAYNPFGVDLSDVRRRLSEAGGRMEETDVNTLHAFAGFDGALPGALSKWNYDAFAIFARNDSNQITNGTVNTQLTQNAIGPSSADGTQCLTAPLSAGGQPIPGCTPANWFNPGNTPMSPAMIASLGGYTGINAGYNQMTSVGLNFTGELFKLKSESPVSLNFGGEWRGEEGAYTYNPIAVAGLDSDYNGANTKGSFKVVEGFAELVVPIMSNAKWADMLEATMAGRISDYSTFGTASTWKLGARYSPIHGFTIRGTAGTGYRAPGITSLYGGQIPNAEAASDPCSDPALKLDPTSALAVQCSATLKRGGGGASAVGNGDDSTQIDSTSGGNTKLTPEKAVIYTAGIVYEPSQVRGLSITADWYDIHITNSIDFITTPNILRGCYPGADAAGNPLPVNQAYCDFVQRNADGRVIDVTDILQNTGTQSTSGVDVALRYTQPTRFGQFGYSADVNYLIKFNKRLADGTLIEGKGNYDLGVNPDYKFNLGFTYTNKGWRAGLLGRFVGSYKECATSAGDSYGLSSGSGLCYTHPVQPDGTPFPVHTVPFYGTFDLNLGKVFTTSAGTTNIGFTIHNLFDAQPAPVYNTLAQTNSDPTAYDYVGRAYLIQLQQKF